jgi:cytochrome c-type biogenesis protein CcmE
MKDLYVRWGAILLIGIIIALLGVMRYQREVGTVAPEDLLKEPPTARLRVLGTVEAGSLIREEPGRIRFRLAGDGEPLSVLYTGKENENLRELKTLVVVGRWNPGTRVFEADELSIVPNYGFITAAYLVGVIPLVLFLFGMERKTRMLYREIKGTSVYKPEEGFDIE